MKIAIILGTRPEIIKMSPIIRECQKRQLDFFILHTGQHYSKELDEQMFIDLSLPQPNYNLGVGGRPYRKQVGLMTKEIIKILEFEKPTVIIVQGDTISVLAGALAANKLNIKIAHHESGLRSHDTTMLEEVNRVIVDHISDFLFTPTPDALKNLHQEGREPEKIHFTGNTIVDAINYNLGISRAKYNVLEKYSLKSKEYFLVTSHRAENVDDPVKLAGILEGVSLVGKGFNLPVIFAIHPRTKLRIQEFNICIPDNLKFIEPPGFLEFLQLEEHAKLILTDSGGVQEEAFILNIPCVTLRENTERPETIEYGANILAGSNPNKILECAKQMITNGVSYDQFENPFGDGKASMRIIDILVQANNR